MMRPGAVMGAVLTMAVLAGLRWASTAPMTVHRTPDAVLRLAWSARPERIETCRRPSDDERSTLPRHMQQTLVCEGRAATYRLQIRHEGTVIGEQVVRGGGLRRDRRLYVFRELPLPAGRTRVDVRFEQIESGTPDERARLRGDAVPPRLALDREITLRPREVVLVTYDAERRALVAVQQTQQ